MAHGQSMSAPPSIGVVIPVHQGAQTIVRAIRSVQRQTLPVASIFVVDDHSTDRTQEAVEAIHDDRIVYLRGSRRGAGHARNVGVGASNSEVIAFLDADDVWYPNKLEQQVPLLDERTGFVGALVHYLSIDGKILGSNVRYQDWETASQDLRRGAALPVQLSSFIMRRKRFEEEGGFDESFLRAQDFELAVRLVQGERVVKWPPGQALAGYMLHSDGVTATSYHEQFLAAELVRARLRGSTRKTYEEWMAEPDLTLAARRTMRSGAHYRRAAVAVGNGRPAHGAVHGALAAAYSPSSVVAKLRWRMSGTADLVPPAVPADVLADFAVAPR